MHEVNNSPEDARPTILYVEDDDDTRHVVKQALKRYGYRVLSEKSEEDAVERARDGRIHADLLLIDLGEPPPAVLAAGRRIRQQALSADAPIVVIAFEYGEDMEGKDIKEGDTDYISYFDGSGHFEKLLVRLLSHTA